MCEREMKYPYIITVLKTQDVCSIHIIELQLVFHIFTFFFQFIYGLFNHYFISMSANSEKFNLSEIV